MQSFVLVVALVGGLLKRGLALQSVHISSGSGVGEGVSSSKPTLPVLAGSSACPASPAARVFLSLIVPPFHGSTALEMIFMSGAGVTTLCSAEKIQCEGARIMEEKGFDRRNGTLWDYDVMLQSYSAYWNLSRPVLLEKSPQVSVTNVQATFPSLQASLRKIPPLMNTIGVDQLTPAFVLMWRPTCLLRLESKKWKRHYKWSNAEWARSALAHLEQQVAAHKFLNEQKAPILVITLAELFWNTDATVRRLSQFLPCAGNLDASFTPSRGVDIFHDNEWKAEGSVKLFGQRYDPVKEFGYDVDARECPPISQQRDFGKLDANEQHRAAGATAYLKAFSF